MTDANSEITKYVNKMVRLLAEQTDEMNRIRRQESDRIRRQRARQKDPHPDCPDEFHGADGGPCATCGWDSHPTK